MHHPVADHGVDFGAFFSLEDYMTFARNYLDEASRKDSNAYRAMLCDVFGPAFRGFLEGLRDKGALNSTEGGEGHRIDFLNNWNAFVAGQDIEPWGWNDINLSFAHHFVFGAVYPVRVAVEGGKDPVEMHRPAYEGMIAKVNAGDIGWWNMSKEAYCFVTDERFHVDVKGWEVRLGKPERGQGFDVIRTVVDPGITEIEVEFKTGDLLIADWFRIQEFTDAVEEIRVRGVRVPSIGSSNGRRASTERHLREHGLITVHVGNSSPSIVALDGTLIFGWIDEDREEPMDVRDLGRVSTGLWNATIIERERLVEIVAGVVGVEEAERKVRAYLAEHDNEVVRVQVEPGLHHLYFHGETDAFKHAFRSDDLPIPDGVEAMFVLSNRKLALKDAPDTPDSEGSTAPAGPRL